MSVHKYFNLKDENTIIAATMFQGAYKKIQLTWRRNESSWQLVVAVYKEI